MDYVVSAGQSETDSACPRRQDGYVKPILTSLQGLDVTIFARQKVSYLCSSAVLVNPRTTTDDPVGLTLLAPVSGHPPNVTKESRHL